MSTQIEIEPGADELVVLMEHNGVRSIFITSDGAETAYLHWMVLGQVEDTRVYLQVPLSLDEADEVITTIRGKNLDAVLRQLPGERRASVSVVLEAADGTTEQVSAVWQLTQRDTIASVDRALAALLHVLEVITTDERSPFRRSAEHARSEVMLAA